MYMFDLVDRGNNPDDASTHVIQRWAMSPNTLFSPLSRMPRVSIAHHTVAINPSLCVRYQFFSSYTSMRYNNPCAGSYYCDPIGHTRSSEGVLSTKLIVSLTVTVPYMPSSLRSTLDGLISAT